MTWWQAILLGVAQGATEFLPISSSGHLVLLQHLFGLTEPELVFDISVHLGTLMAVIAYFRSDLKALITACADWVSNTITPDQRPQAISKVNTDVKLALLIIVGTIPTAIIGLGLRPIVDRIFSSILLVGVMLLITGLLLWVTRRLPSSGKGISGFSMKMALGIGLIQGMAIMPGISRSGSTISMGLLLGLDRETAARYSFLLSIPAIIGAVLLGFKDVARLDAAALWIVLLGSATAALVGYAALSLLVFIVNQGRLHLFSPYCWILGIIAITLSWL
jgi:undecaprenyl-diphosphatase